MAAPERPRPTDRSLLCFGAALLLLVSPLRAVWTEGPAWLAYGAWAAVIGLAALSAARR